MSSDRSARLRKLARAVGYADELEASRDGTFTVDAELANAALAEGLGPMLGHRLKRGDVQVDDERDSDRLLHSHRSCTARNVLVEAALAPVMNAFAEHEIEAVVLKGAALVERVFHHPGCRSMGDVDLLVRRERWPDARVAIDEAGARTVDDRKRSLTMRLYHEVHAALPAGGVLDLHRSLSAWPLFGVDHDQIFRESTPVPWGARVPTIDHLFVCLAMHAAQDGFYLPFRALIDGLALARHPEIRPQNVTDLAHQWKARKATALWLRSLEPYGLPASFDDALHALDPKGKRVSEAREIPRVGAEDPTQKRWETRRHLARSLDGPLRPVAFFAYRGAVFVADIFLRMLPGS